MNNTILFNGTFKLAVINSDFFFWSASRLRQRVRFFGRLFGYFLVEILKNEKSNHQLSKNLFRKYSSPFKILSETFPIGGLMAKAEFFCQTEFCRFGSLFDSFWGAIPMSFKCVIPYLCLCEHKIPQCAAVCCCAKQ